MAFNQNQGHRPSFQAAGGDSLENNNQMPPLTMSPMDTNFSLPATPIDLVFSSQSPIISESSPMNSLFSRPSLSSPMDLCFPDAFPSECSTNICRTRSIGSISPTNVYFDTTNSSISSGSRKPSLTVRTTPVSLPLSVSSSSKTYAATLQPGRHLSQQPSGFSAHRSSILTSRTNNNNNDNNDGNCGSSGSSKQPQQLATTNTNRNPAFIKKLQEMALPLAPLVQLTTGQVHPSFPPTLLSFWLLTDAELEALAHFYHQRTPCRWTACYPCPVAWDTSLALEEKRRRIGKFIGLRGCETPVRIRSEEEILEDARRARERGDGEDEVWRRKLHWY